MTPERIKGYCPRCRHQQIFEKYRIHHGVHFLLSLLTCGLWLISWISAYVGYRYRPWRCKQCNWHRPIMDLQKDARRRPGSLPSEFTEFTIDEAVNAPSGDQKP